MTIWDKLMSKHYRNFRGLGDVTAREKELLGLLKLMLDSQPLASIESKRL